MTQMPQTTENSRSSSSVELVLLPSEGVDEAWTLLRKILAPALLRTRKMSARSLRQDARRGLLQCWIIWNRETHDAEVAFVTELADYAERRVCRVLQLAGSPVQRWRHLIGKLEEWSRQQGCAALEFVGRPGWGRLFPEYREIERVFSKEL